MSNWFGSGLAAAAGAVGGLFVGGAIGASAGGRGEHGLIDRTAGTITGASTGALIGTMLGAFVGAAITANPPAQGGSTIVVNPNNPNPPPLPPAPPAPPGPPSPPASADPILTDNQSVYAARGLLGSWWQQMYSASPQTVENSLYTPVLTQQADGSLAPDPYFVNAMSFFQRWANGKGPAAFQATGLPVTQLPYTDGTLDTYSLQLLQWLQANPGA